MSSPPTRARPCRAACPMRMPPSAWAGLLCPAPLPPSAPICCSPPPFIHLLPHRPGVAGRHPLPIAEQFAAAMARVGFGDDTLVVAYDEGMTGGAARLWWLLRHFGHDQVAVLDGGLAAWLGPLAAGEEEIEPA